MTYSINRRRERVLLHASGTNENAIRLYRSLGFTVRRTTNFAHLCAPG